MKIKDLPKEKNLQIIPVVLPKNVYDASSLPMYGIKTKVVYLQGWVMGDFFVKLNPLSSQIYPMFWNTVPEGIDEWEVYEKKKKSVKPKRRQKTNLTSNKISNERI